MRTIKELQQHLRGNIDFDDKYGLIDDEKVHLLYVSPQFNATGFYRMIAPALELNKTTTHKAILTSIEVNDFAKNLDGCINQLDERLIAWADYIIFPCLTIDIKYLIQAIKIINPQVQLTMDFNRNYFGGNDPNSTGNMISSITEEQLQRNLTLMDMITVSSKSFAPFLQKYLDVREPDAGVMVYHIPSLVSRFAYEEMKPLNRNTSNKIRIGLIKPNEQELLSLKEVLTDIKASFKDVVEFVCFGIPRYSEEGDQLLKEVDMELHDTVSFSNYFKKLNELALDFVLLPTKKYGNTEDQNNQLFLELSVFGIPTVTSIYHTSHSLLRLAEIGLSGAENSDWIYSMEAFISNASYREQIGKNALKSIWKNHSYNAMQIKKLTDIFI